MAVGAAAHAAVALSLRPIRWWLRRIRLAPTRTSMNLKMRGAFRGPVTCIGSFGTPFQDSVATPPSPAPRGWGRGRLEVRGTRWLAIAGSAPTTDGRAAVALCGRTTDQMADSGRGGGRLREPRARGSCVPSIRRGGTSAASICSKGQLLLLGPPSRYEEDLFAVFGLPAP
jgi:hypothetical protein